MQFYLGLFTRTFIAHDLPAESNRSIQACFWGSSRIVFCESTIQWMDKAPDGSVPHHTSTASSWRKCSPPDLYCQNLCQIECQGQCEIQGQNVCQIYRRSEFMSDRVSEFMSDRVSEFMSDRVLEYMSDRRSEFMSDRVSEYMSDRLSEFLSNRMLECMSDKRSESMPNRMSEFLFDTLSCWLTEWKNICQIGSLFDWSLEDQLLAKMLVILIPTCCYRKIRGGLIMCSLFLL